MEDGLADVVFLLLLLSHCLRGRIWFHNEIHVFSSVVHCWFVCSGLLTSKAHQIFFFFFIVSYMNVQRSAIVFYLKDNFTFTRLMFITLSEILEFKCCKFMK